jgi:hypothetical protein
VLQRRLARVEVAGEVDFAELADLHLRVVEGPHARRAGLRLRRLVVGRPADHVPLPERLEVLRDEQRERREVDLVLQRHERLDLADLIVVQVEQVAEPHERRDAEIVRLGCADHTWPAGVLDERVGGLVVEEAVDVLVAEPWARSSA